MAFELESPTFRNGTDIPAPFTGVDRNVSPPLHWQGAPEKTQSFALWMFDPDATRGTFTHWLLWDVPASIAELAEDWFAGDIGTPGRNDFGKLGYGGPLPPVGHGPHRYVFRLYALDVDNLDLREGASRAEFEQAIAGHVVGQTEVTGRFERRAHAHPVH